MTAADEFRKRNTRKASVLQVGGFRPTLDPLASNFGRTPVALAGEEWPGFEGKPLMFVCQMNLTTAPAVPALLADIKLITFFVDPDLGFVGESNGERWCLRAYKSFDGLAAVQPPAAAPKVPKGFECQWVELEDHPVYDDPELVKVKGARAPKKDFDNVARTKIGGYASLIQSEPSWGYKTHPAAPRFALQINSEEKAGFIWGDAGTLYLARGTAAGCAEQWFLDWQCF